MRGIDLMINALDRAECNPRRFGDSWRSQCPAHGSKGGTLKVSEARDKVLFHCFAGCSFDEVLGSLGLSWGDLVEGQSGPVRPRQRKPKREPVWVDPVRSARAYGCRLLPVSSVDSQSRVYVGQCSCGGSVTAGVSGAACENQCPIEAVGRLLLDFRDAHLRVEGVGMEVRTLNVLGCVEKKRGVSQKTGREWVLYAVQADDGNGNPIADELTSFQQIPVGVGEYQIEKDENQWGVRYTIKQPTAVGRALSEQNVRLTRLEALCERLGGGAPAPVQAPVPAQPAPVVVQSGDIPF